MNAIKDIYSSLLVLIFIMMLRGTECFQTVKVMNLCLQLDSSYSTALTNKLTPLYKKTSEELKNKINDAGYDSPHDIEFYESYDSKVLAYIQIREPKIGKVDEEDLKKATLNVLSVNNSCDCKVCKKWSEGYPCARLDRPDVQCRCRLNLCIPRHCTPESQVISCTGNSSTRSMNNFIINRDQKDKNSNTHGADNSRTTPVTDTINIDRDSPAPQHHSYLGFIPPVILIIVIAIIVKYCKRCRREHQSNHYTREESGTNLELEGINTNSITVTETEAIQVADKD